jgi:hypothetical protein
MPDRNVYDVAMPLKAIELPAAVAEAIVRDMRAFFKAKNQLKQDEIPQRELLHGLHGVARRTQPIYVVPRLFLRWTSADLRFRGDHGGGADGGQRTS